MSKHSGKIPALRALVAQSCTLLYRRFAIGRASANQHRWISQTSSRMQFCDTAECNSALRPSDKVSRRPGIGLAVPALALMAIQCFSLYPLAAAADFDEAIHDGIAFISIPAGTFTMGTSDHDRGILQKQESWTRFQECERPPHPVTITKSFLISKCEITQEQWMSVMETNPAAFKGDHLPVESVSWEEVQEFIQKLNEKAKSKYRLPTEAEWEYCCRAGNTNLFGQGRRREIISTNNLLEYAWYRGNAESRTRYVGQRKPNAWGLYDMHGNVWEWCQDWYAADYYSHSPANDPMNTEPSSERVLRGGCWFLDAYYLRSAFRSGNLPSFKSQYVGFRLVREPS
jgi:formylglycine-generating enzyme required for sulfatase activity